MAEPNIPYVEPDEANEAVSQIYDAVESNFGEVLNVIKTLGNSPDFLNAVMGLLGALEGCELNEKYRELAYLKTSQVNNCEY